MTYNDFEIESDLTLRVQAWAQPDEGTALRRFLLVRDLLVDGAAGNVSVWRIQSASTGTWAIVLCGRPEHMVEVEGEPYDLSEAEAASFVARRLVVAAEGHALGIDGPVTQLGQYPDGAIISPDGTVGPYTPRRNDD